MSAMQRPTLDQIIAYCKRRGFVYQSADIYGGLNGVYDFGHLGVLLMNNLKQAWINSILASNNNILFFDGSILGPQPVWKASGHVDSFHDPMVDCLSCKHRFRADEIDMKKGCPNCGKNTWTDIRQFNMMFHTQVGASEEHANIAYLRPETAQSIYINFKNIISTNRIKIPFGVAQVGKAFRNEITPKQFLFRVREFEQMEMEWFCKLDSAATWFDFWVKERFTFYTESLGINATYLRLRQQDATERAHYSLGTSDVEYEYPFGWKELEGIANRGNYDLTQHSKASGKDLSVFDEEEKQSYIPAIVESSVGVGRLFLTVLFDAYAEEEIEGETRVVLRIKPSIAPIKAAFMPLAKKLNEPMHAIYKKIQKLGIMIDFDESGSIGKRYRRQDEIGTPLCFTYDFDSEKDNCVTVRFRDSMEQKRIAIDEIQSYILKELGFGR